MNGEFNHAKLAMETGSERSKNRDSHITFHMVLIDVPVNHTRSIEKSICENVHFSWISILFTFLLIYLKGVLF